MVQYIPRFGASLALSFAFLAAACAKTENNAAADSALNKDIQLANGDSAAQPALTDVPASATPSTVTPTTTALRAERAGRPRERLLPPGHRRLRLGRRRPPLHPAATRLPAARAVPPRESERFPPAPRSTSLRVPESAPTPTTSVTASMRPSATRWWAPTAP